MDFDFTKRNDVDLLVDVNLSKYSTFKLKVYGNICFVKSLEALKLVIEETKLKSLRVHLIGWGANQIIRETKNKLFVKLDFPFDREFFKEKHDVYDLPASISLNVLQSHAQKFGLKGWEVFTGIPASLGGALFMNAGTNLGEIGSIVKTVTVLRESGELEEVEKFPEMFKYRGNNFLKEGDVIISAKLIHRGVSEETKQIIKNYMKMRKETQPLRSFNCGCVYKNYSKDHRAGHFIDTLCLKGLTYKGLEVSKVHANFIENKGGPSSEDFEYFSSKISKILEQHTGIKFELEVKVY